MEKMIQSLSKSGKAEDALKMVDRAIEVFDGNWYFVRLKAETLAEAGKVTEAVNAYEEAMDKAKGIKGEDEKEADKARKEAKDTIREFMEKLVLDLVRQQKTDEALKLTDELTKTDWYFARLRAEILRETGKLDEAIVAFEEAIATVGKAKLDDSLKKKILDRCRYVLSGVYTDLKQIDKAAEQLQKLLKENPESATYHNDLGYIWADHDMNLDESEKLVRKALVLDKAEREKAKKEGEDIEDKDNPAYLDSLGWVLFKKKDFAGAKKQLIEACKGEDGQHVEIYDHLADVHMALGEKDDAIAVWKKALALDNVSKHDDKRKEAVKKKLEEAEKK
ncbi:MAG: tetratricopeptide repeat protein [Gemmataceae bacterium]